MKKKKESLLKRLKREVKEQEREIKRLRYQKELLIHRREQLKRQQKITESQKDDILRFLDCALKHAGGLQKIKYEDLGRYSATNVFIKFDDEEKTITLKN